MLLKNCEVSVIPADKILSDHMLALVHGKCKLTCTQKILKKCQIKLDITLKNKI